MTTMSMPAPRSGRVAARRKIVNRHRKSSHRGPPAGGTAVRSGVCPRAGPPPAPWLRAVLLRTQGGEGGSGDSGGGMPALAADGLRGAGETAATCAQRHRGGDVRAGRLDPYLTCATRAGRPHRWLQVPKVPRLARTRAGAPLSTLSPFLCTKEPPLPSPTPRGCRCEDGRHLV